MPVYSGEPYATAGAGNVESIGIDDTGAVVTWGNNHGAIPSGLTGCKSVAAGMGYLVAVRPDGTVAAWGSPTFDKGQLNVPAGLDTAVQVSAAKGHVLALKADGTVTGWGDNAFGELTIPGGLTNVIQVSAGDGHSLALQSDGTVVAWGNNGSGQIDVPAGLVATKIAAGYSHSLALDSAGTVYAWGKNSFNESTVPAEVSSGTAVSISAGDGHSLALMSDATVVSWGNVSAPALTGVYEIFAGRGFCLAVYADGSMTGWGDNSQGQTNIPAGLSLTLNGENPVDHPITASVTITPSAQGTAYNGGQVAANLGISAAASGYKVQSYGGASSQFALTASGTGAVDWTKSLNVARLQEVYSLTITGAADALPDLQLPISSWQATSQPTPKSSYLQAVIPAASDILESISARQNGELVISKGYKFSDGSIRLTELLRSNFDTFRYDTGPSRFTITVSGYMPGKAEQNAVRSLSGVRSLSATNGKRRARCNIDMFLQPGMTITAHTETFTADYILYFVNHLDKFCEVSER